MKYLLFIFSAIIFISCHDLHQKFYETFHGAKHSVTKDSAASKDSVLRAVTDSSFKK